MRKKHIARRAVLLTTKIALLVLSAPGLTKDASSQMAHTMPVDPRAIVIQWRTLGGLAGRDETPADLTIRADGSVTVGPRLGRGKTAEEQLTVKRLQQLLSFAIDDNDFFGFDSTAVEQAVNAAVERRRAAAQSDEAIPVPSGPSYIDAGTTVILVAADSKWHEVRYHGLFAAAQDFPEIKALTQLRAIELELLGLAEEIVRAVTE